MCVKACDPGPFLPRGAVSREHFQIWADEVPEAGQPGASHFGGIPCAFFLTNYSVNGTVVNGTHLKKEQVPLQSGDSIALARSVPTADGGVALSTFLEFRFDLTGSVLRDADSGPNQAHAQPLQPAGSLLSRQPWGRARPAGSEAAATSLALAASHPAAGATDTPAAASREPLPAALGDGAPLSQLEVDVEPCFCLDVGGTAVRDGIAARHRRIVHGPLREASGQGLCPPLLLGRAQQTGFWQSLLVQEAYDALSRQHLQIEAHQGEGRGPTTFSVRNLSERNPVRVCSNLEAMENARPLDKDEVVVLSHGDVIGVNPNRGSTLWLIFRDLMAGRSCATKSAPPAGPVQRTPALATTAVGKSPSQPDA